MWCLTPSVWSLLPVPLPCIVTSGHLQESSGSSGSRGSQALVLAAKARALLNGRPNASVEDIQSLAIPALRHRILPSFLAESEGTGVDAIIAHMLEKFLPDSLASPFQLFYTLAVSTEKKDLLDPHYLSRIKDLSLLAKVVVDGSIYGVHRSVRQGRGAEFFSTAPTKEGRISNPLIGKFLQNGTNWYPKLFRKTLISRLFSSWTEVPPWAILGLILPARNSGMHKCSLPVLLTLLSGRVIKWGWSGI